MSRSPIKKPTNFLSGWPLPWSRISASNPKIESASIPITNGNGSSFKWLPPWLTSFLSISTLHIKVRNWHTLLIKSALKSSSFQTHSKNLTICKLSKKSYLKFKLETILGTCAQISFTFSKLLSGSMRPNKPNKDSSISAIFWSLAIEAVYQNYQIVTTRPTFSLHLAQQGFQKQQHCRISIF